MSFTELATGFSTATAFCANTRRAGMRACGGAGVRPECRREEAKLFFLFIAHVQQFPLSRLQVLLTCERTETMATSHHRSPCNFVVFRRVTRRPRLLGMIHVSGRAACRLMDNVATGNFVCRRSQRSLCRRYDVRWYGCLGTTIDASVGSILGSFVCHGWGHVCTLRPRRKRASGLHPSLVNIRGFDKPTPPLYTSSL